jgi:ribosome-associated protein
MRPSGIPSRRPPDIPDADVTFTALRANGPGGQNVNKVASAVQLRFDLAGTSILGPSAKQRLRVLAGRRVTDDGALVITAREHRSQEQNRREAVERLQTMVAQALIEPRKRKKTKPTKASQERRLQSKRRDRSIKQMRGRVGRDD